MSYDFFLVFNGAPKFILFIPRQQACGNNKNEESLAELK